MKKFNFPLHTVLNYKEQVLDSLKSEHAQMIKKVELQEKKIQDLIEKRKQTVLCFGEDMKHGVGINMMREYESYITFMQQKILAEQGILQKLKAREEKKREEVVEARKEKASIDKLKEKKLLQYNKESMRNDELFIDEFVSNTMSVHNNR
ncbi:flagellar export protein FliJ [Clostridium sp. E02]|uniref:flagellar export protein FliJ n=1 Tax=Clostridium sp. E02 TaxID=2487134 RepID=UPI000F52F68F|nr:flagellar export protein FliJ [Clostridium sp. E02]